jgi:hypothetical protein
MTFVWGMLLGLVAGPFLFALGKKAYTMVKDWSNKA